MNNFNMPFPPNYFINIPEEINKLNEKIKELEERLKQLENKNNNYLKNDDTYYMI